MFYSKLFCELEKKNKQKKTPLNKVYYDTKT